MAQTHKQRRRQLPAKRARANILTRYLLLCACISYLFLHAVVPAGFMPANLKDGLAYQYCYGDAKSVDFLKRLQQVRIRDSADQSHAHHHHLHEPEEGTGTLEKHLGDHCGFASIGFALLDNQADSLFVDLQLEEQSKGAQFPAFNPSRIRSSIQARAPPRIFS